MEQKLLTNTDVLIDSTLLHDSDKFNFRAFLNLIVWRRQQQFT